ncbi:hypothetical protein KKF11_00825 [Patescibacteria group bacterium]|nr:hypothetical protein [Patescibacteria group bacterium]
MSYSLRKANFWCVEDNEKGFIHRTAWLCLFILALGITFFLFSPDEIDVITRQKVSLPANYDIVEKGKYHFGETWIEISPDSDLLNPEAKYFLALEYLDQNPVVRAYTSYKNGGVILRTTLARANEPPKPTRLLSGIGASYFLYGDPTIESGYLVVGWMYRNWVALVPAIILFVLFFWLYDRFILTRLHRAITKKHFFNPEISAL